MKKILIILFVLLPIIGCKSKTEVTNPIQLNLITLTEAFPGDVLNVNKVELLDGSTGERKIVDNQKIIREWLSQIKGIELIPEENQEQRTGYLFGITLYEGEVNKLGFIPNEINNIYYKNNEEFVEPIRALFEGQFEREF